MDPVGVRFVIRMVMKMKQVIDEIDGLYFAQVLEVKNKYTVIELKFFDIGSANAFCEEYRNGMVKETCGYTGKITVHMVLGHNEALEFLKWLGMSAGTSIKKVNLHSNMIYDRIVNEKPSRVMTDINPAYVSFDRQN